MEVEVEDLTPRHRAEASRMYTDAFLDDPAWRAIGPSRDSARRRLLHGFYRRAVGEGLRHGGPSWCAVRGEAVLGAAVTFGDGLRYPPPRATLVEAPPFILAGPAAALRSARADSVMKRARPREPHLYLWLLAADPTAQRRGVGRALMQRVLGAAREREVPVYLETTKTENLPYYGSFGFRVIGEAPLPRSARVWFLWRDAEAST